MIDKLWKLAEVANYASVRLTTAKKLVSQPDFPPAIRVLERSHPRWPEKEVREYFEARRVS